MGKAEDQARWYRNHRTEHQVRVDRRRRAKRVENRNRVLEYWKTHPCVDCGETDPDMLTFDHVRGKKKLEVSLMVSNGYGWTTIKAEIKKCAVRCWNHHMKRTAEQRRAASSTGRAPDS